MIPPRQRAFVWVLLALLCIPGVVGFELWPASGWRLFSLSRDDSQTVWVLEARLPGGDLRRVSLEELPVAYRLADWVFADLPTSPTGRREEVCASMFEAVRSEVAPEAVGFQIVRDRQRLERVEGGTRRHHSREVVHACGRDR
ncbi:MAG: hypothetical protein ACLGHT_11750 [Acidimicrobiia bacterium]